MSNRTLVELNHDFCPRSNHIEDLLSWAKAMTRYMSSGDQSELPHGVTFKHRRHHSEPCPYEALEAIADGEGCPRTIARQTLRHPE